MAKVFSRATLGKFEDAAASIPLRQLNRAFEAANIRLGKDPGGSEGARKVQFRRYVAGVDQHDRRELEQLGRALGALIAEVATSKVDFLVTAAAGDGFAFADGVFSPATGVAKEHPKDAVARAKELVASACRTAQLEPEPALHALEVAVAGLANGTGKNPSSRQARLMVGVAVAFAEFIAESKR